MSIVRAPRSNNFAIIPNAALDDDSLSFRARGILAFLLAKPDNWRTDAHKIAEAGTEGRFAVLTALKELETAGYLVRRRFQNPNGTWASESHITDTPTGVQFLNSGVTEVQSPNVGSPNAGSLHSEVRTKNKTPYSPPTPQVVCGCKSGLTACPVPECRCACHRGVDR